MPTTEVEDEKEGKDQTLNALSTGCFSSRWSDAVSIATMGSSVPLLPWHLFFFLVSSVIRQDVLKSGWKILLSCWIYEMDLVFLSEGPTPSIIVTVQEYRPIFKRLLSHAPGY